MFLAIGAPGGRATQRNKETHPAQPPPLISHPSSILPLHPPFPNTTPLPPSAMPIRHRQLPVPPLDQLSVLSVCLSPDFPQIAPHHCASATGPASYQKAARASWRLGEVVWVWAGGPTGNDGSSQALQSHGIFSCTLRQ